jgi:amino acid adenylation domain-containing protein
MKHVHIAFEEKAATHPHNTAIEEVSRKITYGELSSKSNELCDRLIPHVWTDETIIAVILPAGIQLIASMLGIFKSGGIYMPLDLAFPQKKLRQIFANTFSGIIVTNKALLSQVEALLCDLNLDVDLLVVMDESDNIEMYEFFQGESYKINSSDLLKNIHPVKTLPENSSYIFYTSGSTGEGKAILGCHKSLSHFIHWEIEEFGINEQSRISQIAQVTFDASLKDILPALCSGGTVCVPAPGARSNMGVLTKWIGEANITILQCVPSIFRLITSYLANEEPKVKYPNLKYVLLAGEMLYARDVINWRQAVGDHVEIINLYGATESTILKTYNRLHVFPENPAQIIPVGKPIHDTVVAVIRDGRMCKPGEKGEVYIKTPYLTKGYIGNDALNKTSFVQNPLVYDKTDIVYKTGDIGRFDNEGLLEILGRSDNQIKINGVRVELGEIEAAVLGMKGIREVVILAHKNGSDLLELACYHTSPEIRPADIRQHLKGELDESIIPSYFIAMEKFPLNINGKVNRKLLPKPEQLVVSDHQYEPPQSRTEECLEEIWKEVLGLNRIGRTVSFFAAGGNSIKAIQVNSRVYKMLGVNLSLSAFFTHGTIAELARIIGDAKSEPYQTIATLPPQPVYDVSHAQKRIWLLSQFMEEKSAYNMSSAYVLKGELNYDALEGAFTAIIDRHEILRTNFISENGEVKQRIHPPSLLTKIISRQDLSSLTGEIDIKKILRDLAALPFDLANDPLLRLNLIKVAVDKHIFLITVHHIVGDDWSMEVLVKEVSTLYEAYRKGEANPLAALPIQYKDYASWQNGQLKDTTMTSHQSYWLQRFSGDIPVLEFPFDFSRPPVKTYNGNTFSFTLNDQETLGLKKLSVKHDATLFMTCLAAFKTLLFKHSGQQDIVLGSPVAGRNHPDLEEQIGLYINMLALRTAFKGDDTFLHLLSKVKQTTLEAYEHQFYPFDKLVDDLKLDRDLSRSPLYDAGFTWHALVKNNVPETDGIQIENLGAQLKMAKADLWLHGIDGDDRISFLVDYNTDLLKESTVEQLVIRFKRILQQVIATPDVPLYKIKLLADPEERRLLVDFNSTQTGFPRDKTLGQLFEEQVRQTPDAVALADDNTTLTYSQLNARSNRLARHLQNQLQVKPGELVAIMADHSACTVQAILGVIKAGAAYLPIDPDYPKTRIEFLLRDADVKVVLTQTEYLFNDVSSEQYKIFALDIQQDTLTESEDDLPVSAHADSLAYLMYTSGSTGSPKGVPIKHKSVARLVLASNYIDIKPGSRLLQTGAMSFDASTFEIWGMLLNGGELHLLPKEKLLNVSSLKAKITGSRIDTMWFTAAWFNELADQDITLFASLKYLLIGGDKLSPPHIGKVKAAYPHITLINGYGPTENTTFSICHTIDNAKLASIPIGRPVSNTVVYILDSYGQPVPIGVPGEIYLGGEGLSEGYWKQEQLSKEKFISNPFSQIQDKLYRTGDRGVWEADGIINFLGRMDTQVKIRGHRIELGEVENAISGFDGVEKVLVLAKAARATDEKYIVGYYTGKAAEDSALRGYLASQLPAYMVPTYLIHVDGFPLNVNGKVDSKLLPDPELLPTQAKIIAPRTALEDKLVNIWRDQLKRKEVGIFDNFFVLGGDSIKAIRLVSALNKTHGLQIEVKDIFNHQDIASLAEYVDVHSGEDASVRAKEKKNALETIEGIKNNITGNPKLSAQLPADWEDIFPMSDIQVGMLYHNLLDQASAMFHDQIYYQIEDHAFDLSAFSLAFGRLVEKHPMLRTSFYLNEFGEPMQVVRKFDPAHKLDITLEDLTYLDSDGHKKYLKAYLDDDKRHPFKPSDPGLWRVRIFRLTDSEYGILWVVHHAIIDGWSNASLLTEFANAYAEVKNNGDVALTSLKSSYRDFIVDQVALRDTGKFKAFWKNKLENYERTSLPFHRLTNDKEIKGVSVHQFVLNRDLTKDIHRLADELEVSVKDICLAAYFFLLKLTTNTRDLTVGMVSNARPEVEDGEKIVGCFLNSVPVRLDVAGVRTSKELIAQVNAALKEVKSYDKLPLPEILRSIGEESTSENPIFDVLYNYVDFHVTDEMTEAVKVKDAITASEEIVNTKFNLLVNRAGGMVKVKFNYRSSLYTVEEIERISEYYRNILVRFAADVNGSLENEAILGLPEREKLLGEFVNSEVSFSHNKLFHRLFEDQVTRTPDSVAVVFEGNELTYADVNNKANQLAWHLRERYNVKPNEIVGLMVNRSQWSVIGLLGILKSGAAYLPIDPENPKERVQHTLIDSGVKVLLTESNLIFDIIDFYTGELVAVDMQFEDAGLPVSNLVDTATERDLAYVIYTSGSTGKPKGAGIEHRSLMNMLQGLGNSYDFRAEWNYICASSVAFDSSIKQMLNPLMRGAQLHIFRDIKDIPRLISYIKEYDINVMSATPLVWQLIVSDMKENGAIESLKIITSGGEQLTATLANQLKDALGETEVVNVYGPTETTDIALHYPIRKKLVAHPPVGKVLPNYKVYILDPEEHLLPLGVRGEICIGGPGVSRGYLGNEALTAEKFLADRYASGGRIYKTGDIGQWNDEGEVLFLGRSDSQTKIRGFRIELHEIRNVLLKHPGISDCIVTVHGEGQDKQLVVYLIEKKKIVLRPSWAEQYVYDDMAYYAMSNDYFRNEKYKSAIRAKVKDKVVLEVGPGSEAILSLMCVECGARKVYAVEILEESYKKAKKRIEALGLQDKIEVIHGDIMGVTLPEKVDCCVSEIIGAIGGSQGAARIMNDVLGKLTDPSNMIPSRSLSKIAAVTLPEDSFDYAFDEVGAYYTEKIFDKVGYRFDLRLSVENFSTNNLISNEDAFEDLDYTRTNALDHTHTIRLELNQRSTWHGFIVWLYLYLSEDQIIDTLNDKEQNLWLPIYLPVCPEGAQVSPGDHITATITRSLSRDGMHPDFVIEGVLHRSESHDVPFKYASFNEEQKFKGNAFYEKVFGHDKLKITKRLSPSDLRSFIGTYLPQYMVPGIFIPMEQFPLMTNGKVDYRALPDPAEIEFASTEEFVAATNETEKAMAEIWKEILGKEQVGIRDNFFEIGGHSLKATQVVSRIQKELQVKIELRDIFATPTIEALASKMSQMKTQKHEGIPTAPEQDHYDVSHAQKRLWIMHQYEPDQVTYNIPMAFEFGGDFNWQAFKRAFETLVQRHEILRTVFVAVDGEPKQKILDYESSRFQVEYVNLIHDPRKTEKTESAVRTEMLTPFDLKEGPLLRVKIIQNEDQRFVFLFTVHHIVADAWSMSVIINEVLRLYNAYLRGEESPLAPLKIQYKDYAAWQNKLLSGDDENRLKTYWSDQLSGDLPQLDLPLDFPRSRLNSYQGGNVGTVLNKEVTANLRAVSQSAGTTLYMTLLAAVNVLLYKYTGQQDIVTGTNVAGRDHTDLEGQIGFYLNTLPLRVKLSDDETFNSLLQKVKDVTLGAYEHQAYPFDRIVSDLNLRHDSTRAPLFDVEVELIASSMGVATDNQLEQFTVKGFGNEYDMSKDDLSFRFTENNEHITLTVRYRSDLFLHDTIGRMVNHFSQVLTGVLQDADSSLTEIEYVTAQEKEQLLMAFSASS